MGYEQRRLTLERAGDGGGHQENRMKAIDHRCPKHPEIRLQHVLRGGAGYCATCRLYVQAEDVPMPAAPKRTRAKAKKKRKGTAKGPPISSATGSKPPRRRRSRWTKT